MATKTERFWYIDNSTKRPRMGIVEKATNATTKDGYTSQFKSISAAKDITIYAIARDSDIVINALTATWTQIPEQFHEVMVNKVIAAGYKDPRNMDINVAGYFDSEYERGVREARRFARNNYTSTGSVRPQDF